MMPLFKKILLYVIAAHLPVIVFSIAEFHFRSPSKPREKVAVQTVVLSPSVATSSLPEKITPKPKKEAKPDPKPKEEKKKTPESPKNEAKPVPKPTDEKKKHLLQQAQEKIAKIDMNDASFLFSKKSKMITGLHIDHLNSANLSDHDAGYVDEIASVLQTFLRLPETGDVVVDLNLKKTGSVSQVKIASSASERNKKYVETTLPNIKFPPFEDHFKNENEHTFHITLSDVKL